MKIKLSGIDGIKKAVIKSEYIALDALLKYACVASTGGEAKFIVLSGEVYVNGEACTQRKRKIRHGDMVRYGGMVLRVFSKPEPTDSDN